MVLHPLNVIMSRGGPMVIDWTNACRGDPGADVALAWALLVAGDVPQGPVLGAAAGRLRSLMVRSFLGATDVEGARTALGDVVAWKVRDPNMSAAEQARMWQLVEQVHDAGAR
jgi:aminoglycoside phosphotransferase (APT) family kinase protein